MNVEALSRFQFALFPLLLGALLMPVSVVAVDEPQSHGHPLSYWLEHSMSRGTDRDRETAKEAEIAIREMGTNAVPALLVWLRYEPSQTKTNILNFLARIKRSAYGRWVPAELTYDHGVPRANIGFLILGPLAADAIPELEAMANDAANPRPAARAMMALSAIGPQALPAVEARLANTNFPLPPDAALNIYLQTRTKLTVQSIPAETARPILLELQTNRNPALVEAATQVLKALEFPSREDKRQRMTVGEAMMDMRLERESAKWGSGTIVPKWKTLSNAPPLRTNSAVASILARPPPEPKGDEPYPYPLRPGTPEWEDATVKERGQSVQIPESWRKHATGWQLFRSAIANPYFRTIYVSGYDMAQCYTAARNGKLLTILREVDSAPDFGTNVLCWLSGVDPAKVAASQCNDPNDPCFMEYLVVCHLAGLNSALETLDLASRQRLFKLAVWDADYFLSNGGGMIAGGPIGLMYAIYKKPKEFRGPLPKEIVLPSFPAGPPQGLTPRPRELASAVAAAKTALGLKERP